MPFNSKTFCRYYGRLFLICVVDIIHFLIRPNDTLRRDVRGLRGMMFFCSFLFNVVLSAGVALGIIYMIHSYILKIEDSREITTSFMIAGIMVAPFLEELIFRFPLRFDNNYPLQKIGKWMHFDFEPFWNRNYPQIVYGFAIVFALVHLSNYDNSSWLFYGLGVFIVLPQFFAGLTLSYTRLRLGFWWAVLQHGLFNSIIFLL